MQYILNKTLESISSLKHFYDIQKDYIGRKTKKGLKENQTGFLIDVYLNGLVHGTEEERNRQTYKSLESFSLKYINVIDVKESSVIYSTKIETPDIAMASKKYREFRAMPVLHINNTIVMLITRFEEFISDFIRYIFIKFPKKYLDNQKLKFSEISELNFKDVKRKVIDREIDEIMRKSYADWFEMFKEHNMKFEHCKGDLEFLKELYATRNIIVHNSGYVNEQYLKNVKNTKYKIGDKININDLYVSKAFECIKTLMFYIGLEGVRLDKSKAQEHIENVFSATFEELSMKNYCTSKTIFYAIYKSCFSDEITKHMARVNYWISKIELNGLEEVKTEIENFDVSALNKSFLLAKNILLLKYKEATMVIEELYQNKELTSLEIESWPLFSKYRESKEFNEFKHNHPELASVSTLETDADTTIANKETTENVKQELKDILV